MSTYSESDFEQVKEEDPVIEHRVFINHVDQYHARHIAAYLTDQVHGALKMASGEVIGEGGDEDAEHKPYSTDTRGNKYEVIGTVKHRFGKITEDILSTVLESDREAYMKEIMNCAYIVFDISQDPEEIPKAMSVLNEIENEINKLMAEGPKTFKRQDRTYIFILISNIMSWGKTKPMDPEDPSIAFTERDYRKRRAHENYAHQIACEREVILKGRKYKEKLKTYVICAGITYGFEQDKLFFLFKMAWENEKYLPLLLPGNNFIPLLHVQDLAKVLHAVCEFLPKNPQFILAVEQTACKLKSIIKSLSKNMGRGRIKEVSQEEAFLYNDMTQNLYDAYTINLNMEPGFIVDDLGVEFRNDLNLAQNMSTIITEFRTSRNLIPMRIFIHGPPGSGKKMFGNLLSETYGIQCITVKSMIEDTVKELRELIDDAVKLKEAKLAAMDDEADNEDVAQEGEEEEEEVDDIEGMSEKLREIETLRTANEEGHLPDEFVIQLMKGYLARNRCQNQGYILVGYPKNTEQIKELFGGEAEGDEEGGDEEGGDAGEGGGSPTVQIMPTHVISLAATDEFICDRIMNLPEKDVQNTNFTEENMLRRLKNFRNNNTEDNTILNFFDENEIHPVIIDIMKYDWGVITPILMNMQSHIGAPVGFEPTPEEQEELMLCREEAEKLKQEGKRIENELFERKALEEYQIKMEEKIQILEGLQMEEEKLLAAQCEPIRNYLMKYVFPTLTEGLLEVARIKPLDPVDYLAEYLFKINPEGKMFDPSYTRQGELIMNIAKGVVNNK